MHGKTDTLNLNNKRDGFTIVELMLLLVVVSLIVASSVSVITRKHKLLPTKTVHGQYFCFRETVDANGDGGNLHEVMYSGNSKIKENIEGISEGFTECKFDPPKKASYLYLQVLGGGGAGGNADFFWQESEKYSQAYFSLVNNSGFTDSTSSTTINSVRSTMRTTQAFKKHNYSNQEADASDNTYGVSPDKVNSFFDGLFSAELYKYLVQQLFQVKVFAWDTAGSGQPGYGYTFNYLDWSESKLTCGVYRDPNSGAPVSYNEKTCGARIRSPMGDLTTCSLYTAASNPSTSSTYYGSCPEAIFYANPSIPDPKICYGANGGGGTVFGTQPYDWDYYTYPVIGQLYDNDTTAVPYSSTNSRGNAISEICNGTNPYGVNLVDYAGCYKTDSLDDNQPAGVYEGSIYLEPDTNGCYVNGEDASEGCLPECTEIFEPASYTASTGGPTTSSRFTEGTAICAKQSDTNANVIKYSVEPTVDATATVIRGYPVFSEISSTAKDGGYPFFGNDPAIIGVKLHHGDGEVSSPEYQPEQGGSSCFTGSRASGTGGTNLSSADMAEIVDDDGSLIGSCPTAEEGNAGDTSVSTNCNGLGGVYPTSPNYYWMMYFVIPTTYVSSSGPIYSTYLDILIKLFRNTIRMTYGERGGAGGYTATFARSFSNSSIKLIPGEGGKPAVVTNNKNDDPASGGNGGTSYLYFHCTSDDVSSCTGVVSAGGGVGGRSRLEEPADTMSTETFNGIADDICSASDNCNANGAYTRNYLEDIHRTSATYTTGEYKGEASGFEETSKLLGINKLSFEGNGTVDLSRLGSGGDGGYVEANCWATPTYFTINNGNSTGISQLKNGKLKLDNPGSLVKEYDSTKTNHPGFVYLGEDDLNAYCQITDGGYNTTPGGWQETAGIAGQPGAIVITW